MPWFLSSCTADNPEPQPEVPLDLETNPTPTNFLLDFLGYIRYFVEQREALVPSFFNHMEMCHHLEAQNGRGALLPTEPVPEQTRQMLTSSKIGWKRIYSTSPAKQLARWNVPNPTLTYWPLQYNSPPLICGAYVPRPPLDAWNCRQYRPPCTLGFLPTHTYLEQNSIYKLGTIKITNNKKEQSYYNKRFWFNVVSLSKYLLALLPFFLWWCEKMLCEVTWGEWQRPCDIKLGSYWPPEDKGRRGWGVIRFWAAADCR